MRSRSAFFAGAPRGRRSGVPVGFHVVLGVGALLVLLVASILVAVFLVAEIKGDAAQLSRHDVPYATQVALAALAAKGIANDERGFLLTGDADFVNEANQRIDAARAAFAEAHRVASRRDQRHAVDHARLGFERWITAVRSEFVAFQAGERNATILTALGPDRRLRKRYERSLAETEALATRGTDAAQSTVASISARTVSVLIVFLVCALTVGVGLALWLIRSILRPVYLLLALFGGAEDAEHTA